MEASEAFHSTLQTKWHFHTRLVLDKQLCTMRDSTNAAQLVRKTWGHKNNERHQIC